MVRKAPGGSEAMKFIGDVPDDLRPYLEGLIIGELPVTGRRLTGPYKHVMSKLVGEAATTMKNVLEVLLTNSDRFLPRDDVVGAVRIGEPESSTYNELLRRLRELLGKEESKSIITKAKIPQGGRKEWLNVNPEELVKRLKELGLLAEDDTDYSIVTTDGSVLAGVREEVGDSVFTEVERIDWAALGGTT